MKAFGRFFIVIWTIIYTALGFLGGFILFPLFTYIFTGRLDDPLETIFNVWDIGKNGIDNLFDNMHKAFHILFDNMHKTFHISHIKFNGKFWK